MPVPPETSSQLWAQRCRARGGAASFVPNILATLGTEMPVWPASLDAASQVRALGSAAREMTQPGSSKTSSQVRGSEIPLREVVWQFCSRRPRSSRLRDTARARRSGQSRLRHSSNAVLRDAAREVVWPVSPETSSQVWARGCCERGRPASVA